MKKRGWVVAAIFCFIVLVLASLQLMTALHESGLAKREPLSLEELERIGQQLAPSAVPAPFTQSDSRPALEHPTSAETRAPVFTRLEKVLTPEQRARRLERVSMPEGRARRSVQRVALVPMKAAEGLLWMAGTPETACRFEVGIGTEMTVTGDWDGARRRFSEVIEMSSNPLARRHACSRLAWLEDDPEKAAKLLELSCTGENQNIAFFLTNAVRLARCTGSDALAEHYLARIRAECPGALNGADGDGGGAAWLDCPFPEMTTAS